YLFGIGKGEQVTEAPDAAEAERIVALRPPSLEVAQRLGRREAIPVVGDIEESAAARTDEARIVDGTGAAAVGVDAALVDEVHRWSVVPGAEVPARQPEHDGNEDP